MTERILVTSALPYANGPLHLGHIAGAYLPADIYVRFKRLCGADVIFICGSDEYGVPNLLAAQKEGISPQELVDRYHYINKRDFERLGMSFDNYSRTTIQQHIPLSQEFFLNLYNKGYINKKTTKQLFCSKCNMFLPDRYVEGTCPHCGGEGARGDQCEKCGRWIDPLSLISPHCMICGQTPEIRKTTQFYLNLPAFKDRLYKYISMNTHWRDNVRNFCLGWLKEGLEERAITRDISWGVPVPIVGYEDKVIYVWFEAPIGYISATREWAEKIGKRDIWERYWKDVECKIIHFIGKDNIVFHAIVWPTILMGQDGYNLPYEIPANEFLNIEGKRLSTSRNWAVWLGDTLNTFHPDLIRYYLTAIAPETQDTEFYWSDFMRRCNDELIDIYANLVNRSLSFIERYYEGRVPTDVKLSGEDRGMIEKAVEYAKKIGDAINGFRMKEAIRQFMELAREGNKYYDTCQPWHTMKSDRKRCDATMHTIWRLLAIMSIVGEPFIPFTQKKLRAMLGIKDGIENYTWDSLDSIIPNKDIVVSGVEVLFKKIEEGDIERERAKLGKPVEVSKVGEKRFEVEEVIGVENISFDEFKKMDLRVASVKACERVEGADKLLKITLSDGEGERVVVAGIAEFYKPEELIGKKLVLLANLEPKRMRGILSSGMVLAATVEEKGVLKDVVLLTLDRDVPDGSRIM
ncbi:MAG: methionine--tRNA ligase [bacterium]